MVHAKLNSSARSKHNGLSKFSGCISTIAEFPVCFNGVNRGFGLKQGNAREATQNLMDRAGDAASKATDTMNSAASGNYLLSLLL